MNSPLLKIIKVQLHDLIRGRWVLAYTVLVFLLVTGLFQFTTDTQRVGVSMMNVVLLLIPLVSILYGAIYFYSSMEFILLLLAQPFSRTILFLGIYIGFTLSLIIAFLLGAGLPALILGNGFAGGFGLILLEGVILTAVFSALAFLVAVWNDQRMRGVSGAFLFWFAFSILYDGLVLLLLYLLRDYPIEKLTLLLTLINPIDLGRILLMMNFDIAALMGYTGAVFEDFFGSFLGLIVILIAQASWLILPLVLGLSRFRRKDF